MSGEYFDAKEPPKHEIRKGENINESIITTGENE
jgi:hypothetical protein